MQEVSNSDKLQVFLHNILSGLVNKPEDIEIEKTTDDMGVLYLVRLHESDYGKVIGKKGNIANAIRVVLRSAGMLLGVRASMKIDVPGSIFHPREDTPGEAVPSAPE